MDKISTIKKNILHFIEKQGIKNEDFYKSCGFSASNFKGIGLNSEMSSDKIVKIMSVYVTINPEWLLTGKGPMLKSEVTPVISETDKAYKELAEARLDVIEGLRFRIASLEEKLSEVRYTQKETFLLKNVAEPAPELIGKKHK